MRPSARAIGLLLAAIAAVTCTDAPTSPLASGPRVGSGRLAIAPSFSPDAARTYSALAQFGLQVTEVRVLLTGPDGRAVKDTVVLFPANSDTLRLELPVPVSGNEQTFTAALELRNAEHVVLFSGTQQVVARSSALPGAAATPPIPIVYTGPGRAVASVGVTPRDTTLVGSASATVTATGLDAAGRAVGDLLVRWTTSDSTLASVVSTGNTSATVRALGRRGTVTISAITPTAVTGSARVVVAPAPSRLVVIGGGGQTAVAGRTLGQPFVVEVQGTDNGPIAGALVSFRAVTAGGSVTTATASTDAAGRASTGITLGRTAGSYTFEAASGTLTPVTVTATATAPPPAALAIVSGDGQVDSVGRRLAPFVVKVSDEFGAPVAGATVTWERIAGTGSLSGASSTTSADGTTSILYTLSAAPRTDSVRATLALPSGTATAAPSVLFTARSIPRGVRALAVVAGNAQTGAAGTVLPVPLTVRATDTLGNPVAGALVQFSSTSPTALTFDPASTQTASDGTAGTRVRLGPTAGTFTGTASIGALAASFTETATGGAAARLVVVSGLPSAITVGVPFSAPLRVQLADAAGNPVRTPNVSVTATGAVSGATNPLVLTVPTDTAGIATFTLPPYVGPIGTATLTLTAPNVATFTSSAIPISAGAPAKLRLATQPPTSTTSGATLSPAPVVGVADVGDNPLKRSGIAVTAALRGRTTSGTTAAPTGSSLGGTATVTTDTSGLASFAVSISGPAATYALEFSATVAELAPVVSGGITLTAATTAVATTVVSPRTDTLTALGDTRTPTVSGKNSAGSAVTGTWTWVSRTPAVATVNASSGLVTAVSNGSAWVVATEAAGSSDSTLIVVQQRAATIRVTPPAPSVYTGGTVAFTAAAVDGNNNPMATQPAITWSSTAVAVATVSSSGVATGVAPGATQIRATSGSAQGVATLTVLSPIRRIDVSFDSTGAVAPDTFTMTALGVQRRYRAVARDTLGNAMSGVSFTWSSTNGSVAVLDSTRGATAYVSSAANGVTSVQATAQGVVGSAFLTVSQVLAAIELTPATATIAVSGTVGMAARGKDANGRYIPGGSFTFASSLPTVATVNATTGVVTGVANGTTNISATSGSITSNLAAVTVSTSGVPAVLSFGRDTVGVGRGNTVSVPILLSKPSSSALTVNLAVADTFAFWSAASVTIPAGQTSANATLNGRNAGTTRITATDAGGTYTSAGSVVKVQANLRLTSSSYALVATDEVKTQVLLSDPSPAGGTFVAFGYGTAGRASVSPDPAFIPQGQLAADVVIRGTAAGSTTITPTATGVNGISSNVSVAAATLTIYPRTLTLGAGQMERYQYVQSPAYLSTPLAVTLRSSDSSVVSAPKTLTLPASSYYAYFDVTALGRGTATVVASATGWRPDTLKVVSTTPALYLCCGRSGVTTTTPAFTLDVYAADSTRYTHARSSSLAVRLSSSDSTVIRVLDTLATIGAGSYSVGARLLPGGAGGSAWIRSVASGHTPDSVQISVTGPALSLRRTPLVGVGQQDQVYVTIPNAISTPLTVTLTSSDSTVLAAPSTVTVLAGQTYQYFVLRGKAAGAAQLRVSAAGYTADSATTRVTTPRVRPSNGGTLDQYSSSSLYALVADSLGSVHNRTTPLAVRFTSLDTTVVTVDTGVTIPSGQYYSTGTAAIAAVRAGTARIIASAPGHVSDTVSWTVRPAAVALGLGSYRIGARQHRQPTEFYVYIPSARPSAVNVTLTQRNARVVGLSATTLTIPAGQNVAFFGISGLVPGVDTITASATGYTSSAAAVVTVTSPKLVALGIPSSATTTQAPYTMTVYSADSLRRNHYANDTVTVRVASTDTTVIRPQKAYVRIPKDSYYANPVIDFVGTGTARIVISDSMSGGYAPDTTNAVTVTGPSLAIQGGTSRLGMRQTSGPTGFYVYTANNVATPLTVRLLSTSTRVVKVSPDSVVIPAGSYYAYFTATAQDTVGTIQIQATATGYTATSTNLQVTRPKFEISTSTSRNTTAGAAGLVVYASDASGTYHAVAENVTVTLASSAPGVAAIDSSTVTIPAGQSYSNSAQWTPKSVGTAQLTATDARTAYYAYDPGAVGVAVTTPVATLSFSTLTLGLGQYSDEYLYLPNTAASAITAPIAHRNGVSSTASSVTVAAGSYYQTVRVQGAAAGLDSLTISPPGHDPARGAVVVDKGRIDPLIAFPASLRIGDSVQVTLSTRDPNQRQRNVSAATTFSLAATAGVQFVSGGTTSTTLTSVTVPADAQSVSFYVKGVSAGSPTVTITSANYTTYTNTITVSP